MSKEANNGVSRPSLKQIAEVLGCPVDRVRSYARKPIPGEPYDPKAINWDAIDAFITGRLEKTGYETLEEVYEAALAVEVKTTSRASGVKTMMLDVDGSETTPARKIAVIPGDLIHDKKTDTDYEVEYASDTIVVYHTLEVAEGKIALSHSIGNRNFNSRFTKVNG